MAASPPGFPSIGSLSLSSSEAARTPDPWLLPCRSPPPPATRFRQREYSHFPLYRFFFTTMSIREIAAIYSCLILHDDKIPITAEKISTLVNAANVKIEPYWPTLFAKLLQKRNVEDLTLNVGSGGGSAPVAVSVLRWPQVVAQSSPLHMLQKRRRLQYARWKEDCREMDPVVGSGRIITRLP